MTSTPAPPGTINNLVRGLVCLLGAGAVVWGLFVLPLFSKAASPEMIATRLLRNDSFKLQLLIDEAQQAQRAAQQSFCFPTALRSLFVLRFFILNKAIADSSENLVKSSYTPLRDAARDMLGCAPTDPFGWLALFWLDAGKYGLNAANTNFLRLSYDFGPNEGWIAPWRIRLAFLLFDRLPPDLSRRSVDEFIGVLNTGEMYSQTAAFFKNAPATAQGLIIEKLKTVNIGTRQAFAQSLRDTGMDVDIPGVQKSARPWQ